MTWVMLGVLSGLLARTMLDLWAVKQALNELNRRVDALDSLES